MELMFVFWMKACSWIDEELFEVNLKGKVCHGDEVKFLKNETVCGVECVYVFKHLPLQLHLLRFEYSVYPATPIIIFPSALKILPITSHLLNFFSFKLSLYFCELILYLNHYANLDGSIYPKIL